MDYDVIDVAPPRKRRSSAGRRLDARDLVRRVDWLNGTLVYWQPPEFKPVHRAGFKSLTKILTEALHDQPRGLYTVTFEPRNGFPDLGSRTRELLPWINPTVRIITRVTRDRLTKAGHAIKRTGEFSKTVKRLVGDVAAWRDKSTARLSLIGRLFGHIGSGEMASAAERRNVIWLIEPEKKGGCLRRRLESPPPASGWGQATSTDIHQFLGELEPNFSPPLETLSAIAAHCDRYEHEMRNALHRFTTTIREAVAVIRTQIPLRTTWFALECQVRRLPYRMLPRGMELKALFPKQPGLRQLLRRVVGVQAKNQELQQIFTECASDDAYVRDEFADRLEAFLRPRLEERIREHRSITFGLIGRIIRFTGDRSLIQPYEKWIGAPEYHAKPPVADEWTRKLHLPTHLFAHSGDRCENVSLWLQYLRDAQWQAHLLSLYQEVDLDRWSTVWTLARLADHPEAMHDMLSRKPTTLEMLAPIISRQPANIGPFIRWIQQYGGRTLGGWEDQVWAQAFQNVSAGQALTVLQEFRTSYVFIRPYEVVSEARFVQQCLEYLKDEAWTWQHLAERAWILRKIALMIAGVECRSPRKRCSSCPGETFQLLLELVSIARDWDEQCLDGLRELVAALLEHAKKLIQQDIQNGTDHCTYFGALSLNTKRELSDGKPDRYVKLAKIASWEWDHDLVAVWKFCRKHAELHEFLGSCLENGSLVESTLKLLQRMRCVLQFNERETFRTALDDWEQPEIDCLEIPEFLSSEFGADLVALAGHRIMAGHSAWPKDVQKVVHREEVLSQELDHLRLQENSPGLRKRTRQLENYLSDREQLVSWIKQDLRKLLRKFLPQARLHSLQQVVTKAIRQHWQSFLPGLEHKADDPDWDNALKLYSSTDSNKQALKRLLFAELEDRRNWRRDHPQNQRYIRRAADMGVDIDTWLAPFRQSFQVHGEEWTVYTELDPVRILQMGNLFGTCLSVGDCNEHSTIANAIEADKRVLFIRDGKGNVIGRKLIGLALDEEGAFLAGFNSYGAGDQRTGGGPWVTILFNLFCANIARQIGARVIDDFDRLDALCGRLGIFLDWYNDGAEEWFWWTPILTKEDAGPAKDKIVEQIRGKDFESCRYALLMLGDRALEAIDAHGPAWINAEQIEWLSRHTHSQAVRNRAKETRSLRNKAL